MRISPISFGQKYISQFAARNNYDGQIEHFMVTEYSYHDEDAIKIGRNAQRWSHDPSQKENFMVAKDYSMSSMTGDETKKFFGIEDTNGKIKKLLVADLGRKYSVMGMIPPKETVIAEESEE